MAHIVITGGAGYIGSVLTGILLNAGHHVTVIDKLLFGGDHMLCYRSNDKFSMIVEDVLETNLKQYLFSATHVIHLAAIVGFPACQQVGPSIARRYNVEATKKVFGAAEECGVSRMLFSSTYSVYGISADGKPVSEESPLCSQSLYGDTKIEAEQYLLSQHNSSCLPIILRFSTLFGISPRTRFDLIINQFVLEALTARKIVLYQKNYKRSFCHISDIVRAVCLALLEWPDDDCRQIWNVGSNVNNLSKEDVVNLIKDQIDIDVIYKDLSFGGDMRDICVSFDKIAGKAFSPKISVASGIQEIKEALTSGLIKDPFNDKYRNARFIVN